MIKKCEICGTEFKTNSSKATCSETCRRERKKRIDQEYRDKFINKPLKEVKCDICGKRFKQTSSRQKRCSKECTKEYERRFNHDYYEAKKADKNASLTDKTKQARAMGMTYGQYKAWLYLQEQKNGSNGNA